MMRDNRKIRTILEQAVDYIAFRWSAFRSFIYSFSYSSGKKVRIRALDPIVKTIEGEIRARIRGKNPQLTVHLIGSASFGIAGRRDLDFFVESNREDMVANIASFRGIFGNPERVKPAFAEWNLDRDGWEVNILLIDPESRKFREQMLACAIIKDDKDVRAEYERLKLNLNGHPQREYERRKTLFFSRITKGREKDFDELMKHYRP